MCPAALLLRATPMRPVRSLAPSLTLGLASLALVHCGGEPAEPVVPGPTPPPPSTVAAAPAPTASAEAAPTATAVAEAPHEPAHTAHAHWTYSGEEGPSHWGDLSPDFAACKTGASQSPIDIVTKKAELDRSLGLLAFEYKAPLPLQIWNNGHTVQVQNSVSESVKIAGGEWKLVQFHMHSPSEHAIDGKLLDLELHLVHASDKGELSVVGLLFRKGKENKALAPVFDHIPTEVAKEAAPVAGVTLDLAKILPAKPTYYTYTGSLTTPKCTEGVHWYVLQTTAEISDAQLQKFHAAFKGDTNRPVQPLGARKVTHSL